MARIERLDCKVKNYAWGKQGDQSEVAALFAAGHSDAQIGAKTPYAELWIGTHPDGPARVRSQQMLLSEHVAAEEYSTKAVHLPYIMKIMSIEHTLSLQVHPNKAQAAVLNQLDPANYPDQNHKPELAYALSRFELLCGFRPAQQIAQNMKAFPELCNAMGKELCQRFIRGVDGDASAAELTAILKQCFSAMISLQNGATVRKLLNGLLNRIKNGVRGSVRYETIWVILDMDKRFPHDIACMSPLLLNHIVLEPGECVYYGAQELHAYLRGECVECVSCSNNTIRAGLTSKFVDRPNLIEMLSYRMEDPSFYYVLPRRLKAHPNVIEFVPDCDDFQLQCLQICANDQSTAFPVDLPALECASTFVLVEAQEAICVELGRSGQVLGERFATRRGDIFYIPAGHVLRFVATSGPVSGYRTFSYEEGPDHSKRNLVTQERVNESQKPKTKATSMLSSNIFEVESEMDGFI